jgi:SWI/SNF-related matrix-associated actin-dependent regulator of chromatin subfamily B protein 1
MLLTMCAGKYWHRHRKPRPVDYHSDLGYHQRLMDEAARVKALASRKKSGRPLPASMMEKEESTGYESPSKGEVWVEVPRRTSSRTITRVQSPATSDDSGDEAPLAARQTRNHGSEAPTSDAADMSQGVRTLLSSDDRR